MGRVAVTAPPVAAVLAAALAAVFGVRAVQGFVAGPAFSAGWRDARDGRYADSLASLERAAVGAHATEAAWLRGEVLLGSWDAAPDPELLERARAAYLEAARSAPASGWPWAGLGTTALRRELAERRDRRFDLSLLGAGPWAAVGRSGRDAVGLLLAACELEPHSVAIRDHLLDALLRLGLEEEAVAQGREAGRIHPNLAAHERLSFESLPRPVLEAFADGAREGLGHAPMIRRDRHLLALGQLERRLGRLDRAVADLREASTLPAEPLQAAEVQFHLALALFDAGESREAESAADLASRQAVFRSSAADLRSRIAEREGRVVDALDWAERAWGMEPKHEAFATRAGRLAEASGDLDRALRIYRRAAALHPASSPIADGLARAERARGERQ